MPAKVPTEAVALVTDLERAGFHVTDTQGVVERDARSLESVAPSEIEVRLVRKGDEIGVEDHAHVVPLQALSPRS